MNTECDLKKSEKNIEDIDPYCGWCLGAALHRQSQSRVAFELTTWRSENAGILHFKKMENTEATQQN